MRNEHGNWINGFARNCGKVNSVMAKLWALRDGLQMAATENIHNLIIELDALAVVHLMKNSFVNFSLEPLLTNCKLLLKKFPNLRIEHVYREANQCADALARIGITSDVHFLLFAHPPPVVDRLCTLDIEGAFFVIDWFSFNAYFPLTKKKKKMWDESQQNIFQNSFWGRPQM